MLHTLLVTLQVYAVSITTYSTESIGKFGCSVTKSRLTFFATPWTVACQAPLSMGLPRQEYWSGLPFLSPRDLPDPGIKPASPAWASGIFTTETSGKHLIGKWMPVYGNKRWWELRNVCAPGCSHFNLSVTQRQQMWQLEYLLSFQQCSQKTLLNKRNYNEKTFP